MRSDGRDICSRSSFRGDSACLRTDRKAAPESDELSQVGNVSALITHLCCGKEGGGKKGVTEMKSSKVTAPL